MQPNASEVKMLSDFCRQDIAFVTNQNGLQKLRVAFKYQVRVTNILVHYLQVFFSFLFFSFLEYILRGKHGSERIEYFTGVKREIINTLSPITNKSTMSENPSIRNALFIVSDVLIHFTPRGVGCIFYEMATGRPLFPGSTVEDQLHLIFKVRTVLL